MFYRFVMHIARFLLFFFIRLKAVGTENIIMDGGVIFAANHKSWLDPVVVAVSSPRKIAFMSKKELFKNKIVAYFLKSLGAFPVNRGKGDIGAIKTGMTILNQGQVLMIFPEGKRLKKGESVPAKPGVALFATHNRVPVIPILIDGDFGFMKKITVIFGKPICFDEYYDQKLKSEQLTELSQNILDTVYALKENK